MVFGNGELYYAKVLIGDKEVLNYLLCEKIANTIYELQTSHFVLAKIENKIGLASLNFRHPNINYFYANQDYFPFWHPHETLVYLKQFFIFLEPYYKLVDDLLKLVSFHIYTGLRDLINCNLLFQQEIDGFSLAPIYDFDFSFENGLIETYYYKSSICNFKLPSDDLNELISLYPKFREYLLLMLEIDMEKILVEIETEHHLEINELYQEYYQKQDKIKKDFIRNLHL